MNDLLAFDIDAGHYARQLRSDKDRAAINNLAHRCVDYLRTVTTSRILRPDDVPRAFFGVMRTARPPGGPDFLLGIHARTAASGGKAARLVGALNFIRPSVGNETWYIVLLLLEPAVRGQGLGVSTHRAFAHWAAVRGAKRLTLSVYDRNQRAGRFWRDRLGYEEFTPRGVSDEPFRQYHLLQCRLQSAAASSPWAIHRPSDPLAA